MITILISFIFTEMRDNLENNVVCLTMPIGHRTFIQNITQRKRHLLANGKT